MAGRPKQAAVHEKRESAGASFGVKAPTVVLPKGGGAIRGMGEKFAANPVTGIGSMSVPIATSPGCDAARHLKDAGILEIVMPADGLANYERPIADAIRRDRPTATSWTCAMLRPGLLANNDGLFPSRRCHRIFRPTRPCGI